jgi:pyruvate/2-oxoacid:ferredoxin oxidoreductase alpha subunit
MTDNIEFDANIAVITAKIIESFNHVVAAFAQQYVLQHRLHKFEERENKAASEELQQLHKRNCSNPVDISNMIRSEKMRAMQSLLVLTEN